MSSPIKVHSPLGKELVFMSMTAHEAISSCYEFTVDLVSQNPDLDFQALLGEHMSIEFDLPVQTGADSASGQRFLDGIVSSMSYVALNGRLHHYRAVLRPWLAMLAHTRDHKIFQNQDALAILEEVFSDAPNAKWRKATSGSYSPWTYCVQYAESDLNFIQRMMEREGISFYFEHELGKHTLVLADSPASFSPLAGYERIPFDSRAASAQAVGGKALESITQWQRTEQVRTGAVAMTDYDFTRPSADLSTQQTQARDHAGSEMELFEYPGEYQKLGLGEQHAQHQMEALYAETEQCVGLSQAPGLSCGRLFTLANFPRKQDNLEYLVTSTRIQLTQPGMEGKLGETASLIQGRERFSCEFQALDAKTPYRSPRKTQKPRVPGPQTAQVVGPAGDEIHTDAYGRVKVHFHWDRYGKRDGGDTCWVRVSQPWAGKNFGFQAIPRIGQEVIVDFLEGDPDQPIITGRVYNAEQMSPWDLPAHKTQSGVLTRSTTGGAYENANALRFEDKKGAEQLWLHAEKDQLTEVENDEDKWVGNDRRKTIDGHETTIVHKNRTETVDLDETITIHKNRTERVDLNESISIGKNRVEDVELNEAIEIGQNRTEYVGANETITIAKNRTENVNGAQSETVAKTDVQTIGLAKMLNVGLAYSINVGAAMNTIVGGLKAEQVGLFKSVTVMGGDYSVNVPSGSKKVTTGANIELTAKDEIKLTVGKSSLVMKSDGTISVNGKEINLDASAEINQTAKADINMRGKNIKQNG